MSFGAAPRFVALTVGFVWMLLDLAAMAQQVDRSWHHLTTGNGHGFQVFDRNAGRLIDFLEHPYRYVAPPDERRDGGIGRRDLAHDIYFGVDIDGQRAWLSSLQNVGYEEQTHIIGGRTDVGAARFDIRYWSPFGLDANAMIMVAQVTNRGGSPLDVTLFAKPNLKLGLGRVDPSGEGEEISWTRDYGAETGTGGGHVVYFPIGGTSTRGCGVDSTLYEQVLGGTALNGGERCQGNDQVLVTGQSARIEPGASFWWGQAILFVNDNPNEPQASDFKDDRDTDDLVAAWRAFAGEQDAEAIYRGAMAEFEAWRVAPSALGLNELTVEELEIWRQSETVLRMGQVMEATQRNRRNRGMFLAALPIGEWHTGWVRDGAYAVVAQAMNGHLTEARVGVEFFLNAWAGFFDSPEYLGRAYRVSSVRYYGNGKEEGDFNFFGPNVETDGFGLVLWAARAYLHYSCDADWLSSETLHGDTVFEALTQVAADIDALTANDLPLPECSIWEVHWGHKKVFTYTAATSIRGMYDFAAIADVAGRPDLAAHYRGRASAMLQASLTFLVNNRTRSFASHQDAAPTDVFVDGSTVEMLHWDLVKPGDPVFEGTLQNYERLRTSSGGYRRLEPRLSLNGEPQAGTYDLSEWILLDLRIGEIFRRAGDVERAAGLLNKVTQAALANDGLVPELFQPDQYGVYTGVVPMVGYGAGAWQMAQLEKYGLGAPAPDADWGHCVQEPEPGGAGGSGGTGGTQMGMGGRGGTGGNGGSQDPFAGLGGSGGQGLGPGQQPMPDEPDPFAGDQAATFCSSMVNQGGPFSGILCFMMIWLCLSGFKRGRHVH